MNMYPERNLYTKYKAALLDDEYSAALPDITRRVTLYYMNCAANLCDKWDTFLDVGGGCGHYSTGFSSIFSSGVLAEVSNFPEHKVIKERFSTISIFNGLIEDYPDDKTFDFILLGDVFEHIEDIDSFVQKLGKLQEVGGVVYIVTPNPIFCGPAPESAIYFKRSKYGHIKHYTRHEIEKLMGSQGYDLIFSLYEETPLRQTIKRIVKGISRRDRRWSSKMLYRMIRPAVRFLFNISVFKFCEWVTYHHEKKYREDQFTCRTQDLAFKKTKRYEA